MGFYPDISQFFGCSSVFLKSFCLFCIQKLNIMNHLHTYEDVRGKLTLLRSGLDVPFDVKRIYWIYDVPSEQNRGRHANHITWQYLVAVKGSLRVTIEDRDGRRDYCLQSPDEGLLVPPMTWNELYDFSEGAVLLVLASHDYEPETYINSLDEFRKLIAEK